MIERDTLPEDAADWNTVDVRLDPLDEHESACPITFDEVMDYVRRESGDVDRADPARLTFTRNARIGSTRGWLWTYTEEDGSENFVTFLEDANGSSVLGLAEPNGLSSPQFLLAEYFDEVYWS